MIHLIERRKNRIVLPNMKAEKESRDSFSDEINIILHAYSGQGLRQIPGMQCGRIIWWNMKLCFACVFLFFSFCWSFSFLFRASEDFGRALATSCEGLTHWKRLWCWEGLGAGGEGDDRGWDGWMASLTRWTWVWVNSGSWWWTGRPGVLQFMGSQRVGHDWATELNCTESISTLMSESLLPL